MEYWTVRQAAAAWKRSERAVQQLCTEGRIPGARKFGKAWAIPAETVRPVDLRRTNLPEESLASNPESELLDHGTLMPLMNTAFAPGGCLAAVEAMEAGPRRDIALAEYRYFSGRPEAAVQAASAYFASEDLGIRLSAHLLCAFAYLSLGRIAQARYALNELNTALTSAGRGNPQLQAASAFVAAAGTVLLHLPLPEELPPVEDFLPLLPPGLRAFACYVQAHYLYLRGSYAESAGMAEGALLMGAARYPIPAIYLHLAAVMDYMSLKEMDRAGGHLLAAWELARPDDLIEGFGEHHGLLGGMLEAVMKPNWPEDFRRIIEITYRFSAGWRRVHNPETGHDVADELTTTEFAVCMLAARGWTNPEIAKHLKISHNTVKHYISAAMEKLHINQRQDLKQYMLL